MYIFKNAKKNLLAFKNKNMLMSLILFIVATLCCISLSVLQASKKAEIAITSNMTVSGYLSDFEREDMSYFNVGLDHLSLGTRALLTSISLGTFSNRITLDILKDLGKSEYVKAQYHHIKMRVRGSENFKSYALYANSDYNFIFNAQPARAFSNTLSVNLVKGYPENDITKFLDGTLTLVVGKMLSNDSEEYQCLIDSFIATKYEINIGDTIDVLLGNSIYYFDVVGIYSSPSIEEEKNNPSTYNYLIPRALNLQAEAYIPSLYVNMSGYELAEEHGIILSDDLEIIVCAYESDEELTEFITGEKVIIEGQMFDPKSDIYECVIAESVALHNEIAIGDYINITNPYNKSEFYKIKVVGTYYSINEPKITLTGQTRDSLTALQNLAGNKATALLITMRIPLNVIYMSYSAVAEILDTSSRINNPSTEIQYAVAGTFLFEDTYALARFKSELERNYYPYSTKFKALDLQDYFDRLVLIKRTTNFALISFLIEILIGGLFLIVFQIFNLRERKYEIGVLVAIGMSKKKIVCQFLVEILTVSIISILLGSVVGSILSKPINNYLSKQDVNLQQAKYGSLTQNFGRIPNIDVGNNAFFNDSKLISSNQISVQVDIFVLLKLVGISLILIFISISGTLIYIFLFEPTKILSDVY